MELKHYQTRVLNNLEHYLEKYNQTHSAVEAYELYLADDNKKPGLDNIKRYVDDLKNDIPKVCSKVPTGGGKTFIGVNAIKILVDNLPPSPVHSNVVIWLVPKKEILKQTYNQFCNPSHPSRITLNRDFANRVEVLNKEDGLLGRGFNQTSLCEQLTIFILSYDSFKNTKDGRRAYQENSALYQLTNTQRNEGYAVNIEGADNTALITALANCNPIVIVDESHHAKSKLSVDMLRNLNPRFVLELTATPSNHSNLISRVTALELKKEEMVKLPVIVFKRGNKSEVVHDAVVLQRKLEETAIKNEELTDKYIRPIALLQAEHKGSNDAETFEKLRAKLIDAGIPEDQIAIRTGAIDELKDIDLMSRSCPVRFVITVEALSEGWDCPFAYILASVANKNSKTSVEQIVGRILRQPYAKRAKSSSLNTSYILTSSSDFNETVNQVVSGLNGAGFSKEDVRSVVENSRKYNTQDESSLGQSEAKDSKDTSIDDLRLSFEGSSDDKPDFGSVHEMIDASEKLEEEYAKETNVSEPANGLFESDNSTGLGSGPITYRLDPLFQREIQSLAIPQFVSNQTSGLFSLSEKDYELFEHEQLLDEFNLSLLGTEGIHFSAALSETMKQIDITEANQIKIRNIDQAYFKELEALFNSYSDKQKREAVVNGIMQQFTNQFYERYGTRGLKDFVIRVVQHMKQEEIDSYVSNSSNYARTIMHTINKHVESFKEKEFYKEVSRNTIFTAPYYKFPFTIKLSKPLSLLDRTLYTAEENDMNNFEYKMAELLANSSNILWWHRIIDRKPGEFFINGPFKHYPDFICASEKGNIIAIETKGEQLKNDDSVEKLRLGSTWADNAGTQFKYFMIFEHDPYDSKDSFSFNQFREDILLYL